MSLSTFCLASLLASTFSAVLCVSQISSPAPNDILSDEGTFTSAENEASRNNPSNMALFPDTIQDNPNMVNGLEAMYSTDNIVGGAGLPAGDAGSATMNNIFGDPSTPLLAQAQTPDEPSGEPSGESSGESSSGNIENTPSEEAAEQRADKRRPAVRGTFNQGGRARQGYDDDKCPGESRWACCNRKWGTRSVWYCEWLSDNSVCSVVACCLPNNKVPPKPDEYCPSFPPERKSSVIDNFLDMLSPLILAPGGGGSTGAAGAAGAGAGAGGAFGIP